LGNSSANKSHSATWQDLQNALSVKHPGISKTQLRKTVNANRMLFSLIHSGVKLCKLDHDFVRAYFELSQWIEVLDHQYEGAYSSSQPVHVQMGASILVSGLVCALSVSLKGNAVLFKFGGFRAYRLENLLPGISIGGQMMWASLRIRKFCQIFYSF
jgi:hypothetical protein